MIDTIVLFIMLFCSGYQTAPEDYIYIDQDGTPQLHFIDDQCKQNYHVWLANDGHKPYYDDDPKNGSLTDILTPN